MSRIPVRREGSSTARTAPWIKIAAKACHGCTASISITINASTAPAVQVLTDWAAIRTIRRSNRSAIRPVNVEKTGRGRLLKTRTSPNCRYESVSCRINQLRTSNSVRRANSPTLPMNQMVRKLRFASKARAVDRVGCRRLIEKTIVLSQALGINYGR